MSGKLIVSGTVTNSTTSNVRAIWLRGAAEGEWRSPIADSAGGLGTAILKDDVGVPPAFVAPDIASARCQERLVGHRGGVAAL